MKTEIDRMITEIDIMKNNRQFAINILNNKMLCKNCNAYKNDFCEVLNIEIGNELFFCADFLLKDKK